MCEIINVSRRLKARLYRSLNDRLLKNGAKRLE